MESDELKRERWIRNHEERFGSLEPRPGLGAATIKVIQALARAIGLLALGASEENIDRRFRSVDRVLNELSDTLDKIGRGAND